MFHSFPHLSFVILENSTLANGGIQELPSRSHKKAQLSLGPAHFGTLIVFVVPFESVYVTTYCSGCSANEASTIDVLVRSIRMSVRYGLQEWQVAPV